MPMPSRWRESPIGVLYPSPENVMTLQGGCAESPGMLQAVWGRHGTGAVAPSGQYAPIGHNKVQN